MEDAKLHDEAAAEQAEAGCDHTAADTVAFGPHGPGDLPYPIVGGFSPQAFGPRGPGTIPKVPVPEDEPSVRAGGCAADVGADAGVAASISEPFDARAGDQDDYLTAKERPRGPGGLPVKS